MGLKNYSRFFGRGIQHLSYSLEQCSLILSPHLDDVFLSLSETITAGKLGKNIIAVNLFSVSDSLVQTNANLSFNSVARSSVIRMQEEINFSMRLAKKGINYIPLFFGVNDAAIATYYKFIFSQLAVSNSPKIINSKIRRICESYALNQSKKLHIEQMIKPLIMQMGRQIKLVVGPAGIGCHIDHLITKNLLLNSQLFKGKKKGMFIDIPYAYSHKYTEEDMKNNIPMHFKRMTETKFSYSEKLKEFKSIYPSQYSKNLEKDFKQSKISCTEKIFWS